MAETLKRGDTHIKTHSPEIYSVIVSIVPRTSFPLSAINVWHNRAEMLNYVEK